MPLMSVLCLWMSLKVLLCLQVSCVLPTLCVLRRSVFLSRDLRTTDSFLQWSLCPSVAEQLSFEERTYRTPALGGFIILSEVLKETYRVILSFKQEHCRAQPMQGQCYRLLSLRLAYFRSQFRDILSRSFLVCPRCVSDFPFLLLGMLCIFRMWRALISDIRSGPTLPLFIATEPNLTVDLNGDVGFCRASQWYNFYWLNLGFSYFQNLFPAVKLCSLSFFIVFPVVLFNFYHFPNLLTVNGLVGYCPDHSLLFDCRYISQLRPY